MSSRAGSKKQKTKEGTKKSEKKAPELQEGLVMAVPPGERPWLNRCIQRWNLCAPFDPSVTEEQWKAYHAERMALECNVFFQTDLEELVLQDQEDGGSSVAEHFSKRKHHMLPTTRKEWEALFGTEFQPADFAGEEDSGKDFVEEFDKFVDDTRTYVEKTMAGCGVLKGFCPSAAELTAKGVYVLKYDIRWEEYECPRTVTNRMRLYSLCGTARSVDIYYEWHQRARWSYVERFAIVNAALRSADAPLSSGGSYGDCAASDLRDHSPQEGTIRIAEMEREESGYENRKLASKKTLAAVAAHLFGGDRAMSERKCFMLLLQATGHESFGDCISWAFKVGRRKMKLLDGEESENHSDSDRDSGNENRRPRGSSMGGSHGDEEDCVSS